MSDKFPFEDLTRVPEEQRTYVLDVPLNAEQRAALQKDADARGMTLEEYVLGVVFTTLAVTEVGGGASSNGGSA
jgi:hypothetical protein